MLKSILTTAGKAAAPHITADRTVVQADGQDLSYLVVEAVDAEGRFQPHADQEVQFAVSGPVVIAAVGNGDTQDNTSYQGDRRKLFEGRTSTARNALNRTRSRGVVLGPPTKIDCWSCEFQ